VLLISIMIVLVSSLMRLVRIIVFLCGCLILLRPVIILGFGEKVPHPDEACKRLWESDTMIHGERILNDILKSQEDFKNAKRYAADQASSDSAERVEKFLRGKGHSPIVKVFPNDKKGVIKSDA
jgi:hypothetical protein